MVPPADPASEPTPPPEAAALPGSPATASGDGASNSSPTGDPLQPVDSPPPVSGPVILEDRRIVETVERLQTRIGERFPSSGLYHLCGQLLLLSQQASRRSRWIARPTLWIRALGYLLAAAIIALLLHAVSLVRIADEPFSMVDLVTMMEAGINELLLLGAALYFLISLETRIKRRRALAALHELRSMAHVIDMHQLTKDPERTQRIWTGTEHSPQVALTPLQLNRYLDYCSEMLSLTGKIAALYVQRFEDAVSLAAVSEIEQLTTGLSRKIFQKITLLQQYRREATQDDVLPAS